MIMAELKAVHVICGFNYRFGRGRAGAVEFLQEQGRRYGFNVTVVPSVHGRSGELISSTLIRSLLAEGQIQEAAECLGRFPAYRGVVVPGQGRAASLGSHGQSWMPPLYAPDGGISPGATSRAGAFQPSLPSGGTPRLPDRCRRSRFIYWTSTETSTVRSWSFSSWNG